MLKNRENRKLIIRYVLPSVSATIVSFTYGVIDGMFVGQGVGENALAAVNIAVPFTQIITGLASMFTIGGATIMAICKGRKEYKKSNTIFMTSASCVFIMGILFSIIGAIFSKQIALIFGATNVLLKNTAIYTRYYCMFSIFSTVSILASAFVRNDGSPGLAFWGMISGAVTNIFLDWLFVFPFQMGIMGAAIASGLGQIVSCLVLSIHFIRKKGILRIQKFSIKKELCTQVFTRGLPEFVIQMSQPITIFCYNRVIIQYLGESGLAAFSATTYLLLILLGAFLGISQGIQPLIGDSFGKNKFDDVNYFFRTGLTINIIIACVFYTFYYLFGKEALSLFITDRTLMQTSYNALISYGLAYIPSAANIIYITYFLSTKVTNRAMIISCSRGILLNSILIFTIPAIFGTSTIWLPILIAETITLIIAVFIKNAYNHKLVSKITLASNQI